MASKIDIIYGEHTTAGVNAEVSGEALWLSAKDFERVSGWTHKSEGFCKDDVCVPVPPARAGEMVASNRYNLTAVATLLGQPIVADPAHGVWCIGEAAAQRRRALTSLNAPDFELPDLSGRAHRLSDYRGKKVLLVSWASW